MSISHLRTEGNSVAHQFAFFLFFERLFNSITFTPDDCLSQQLINLARYANNVKYEELWIEDKPRFLMKITFFLVKNN